MQTIRDDAGYYKTLDVSPSASAVEIRKNYMRMARALHPDKNSSAEAHAQLQAAGEAWAVLKNKTLRGIYDRDGKEGLPDEVDDDEDVSSEEDEGEEEDSEDSDDDEDGDSEVSRPPMEQFFSSREPSLREPSHNERDVALQIADAVAEAILRTEASAAARYQRALASLIRGMDPQLDSSQASEKASEAWAKADLD